MLGLLSSFNPFKDLLARGAPAVGVDLGTETLRLAQVHNEDAESMQLLAAASRDIPPGCAEEPIAYAEFCATTLRELWREGGFTGKRAVLGLPSSMTHLLHLRLPKMDPASTQSALAFEAAGKVPFDPVGGILRHHVVGDVYSNDGPRQEVICTAVRRDYVELLLNAAEKARLEVAGLVASPMALRDCFGRLYRRQADVEVGFCIVDLGRLTTRVTIMRAGHMYFARSIGVGSEHINEAVADALGVRPAEAKLLRQRLAVEGFAQAEEPAETVPAPHRAEVAEPMYGEAPSPAGARRAVQQAGGAVAEAYVMARPRPSGSRAGASSLVTEMSVAAAIEPVVHQLADELQRCRRYHESTFPNVAVDRLVFVGGEANSRGLCQALARRLGIAAQLGDPIQALCPDGHATAELAAAGIDRRRPQPAWAVACGLSLGAANS